MANQTPIKLKFNAEENLLILRLDDKEHTWYIKSIDRDGYITIQNDSNLTIEDINSELYIDI